MYVNIRSANSASFVIETTRERAVLRGFKEGRDFQVVGEYPDHLEIDTNNPTMIGLLVLEMSRDQRTHQGYAGERARQKRAERQARRRAAEPLSGRFLAQQRKRRGLHPRPRARYRP